MQQPVNKGSAGGAAHWNLCIVFAAAAFAACSAPQGPAPTPRTAAAGVTAAETARAVTAGPVRLIGGQEERFEIVADEGSIAAMRPSEAETYLDLQQARLEAAAAGTGIAVDRQPGALLVTMPGAETFDVNSAVIGPKFRRTLDALADVLATYEQSYVDVYGHTDATGSDIFNMTLSQRRAESVATYFAAKGVERVRLATMGRGELEPVATNETEAGRARNRRVEVRVVPITEPLTG